MKSQHCRYGILIVSTVSSLLVIDPGNLGYASLDSNTIDGLGSQFCAALNRGDLAVAEDLLRFLDAGSISTAARVICGFSDLSGIFGPTATGLRFSAANIAQTNSMKLDSDVKNLVVLIPDKRLVNQGFLPLDATIVEGTKVFWSNADKLNPHGISLVRDSDNQVLLTNGSIPYKNSNSYTFDTQGTYTFSDPASQDPAAPPGKVNVIAPANAPDNLSTNSTQATAGLFVVQAEDKDYFDQHFNTLGYHIEDSYKIPGPEGNDIQIYVYTQKSTKDSTINDRTALKIGFVNGQIEEG